MISSSSNYRESKSVLYGGVSMNRSKAITQCRTLPYIAMLLCAIFTILLVPAFGQQEVDPTWYDPWIAPSATAVNLAQPPAAVHSSQSPVATNRGKQSAMFASPARNAAKVRSKGAQLDHSRHDAARKSGGTPPAGGRLLGAACLRGFEPSGFEPWDSESVPNGDVTARSD